MSHVAVCLNIRDLIFVWKTLQFILKYLLIFSNLYLHGMNKLVGSKFRSLHFVFT